MAYGYIYRVVDPYTERSYIGQSTRPLSFIQHAHYQEYLRLKREKRDLEDYPFYAAIDKLGIRHFIWEILGECSNQLELNLMEQRALNYYRINGGVYNTKMVVYGAESEAPPKPDENFDYDAKTRRHSPETIAKMTGQKRTPDQVEKTRLSNTGRVRSLETRMKNSTVMKTLCQDPEYMKKRVASLKEAFARPEVKEKFSKSRKGVPKSDEMKRKISIANKGKKLSEETLEKLRIIGNTDESKKQRFSVTFPDGHVEEIKGIKRFCREHGLLYTSWACLERRGYKTYKGYSRKKID